MGKIAPHKSCEVRLVLSGTKPLATIEKGKDQYGYAIAVALSKTGLLKAVTKPTMDSPTGEIVFVKPANHELLHKYFWLLDNGAKELGIKNYHRQMGKLFGYTDSDVEEFINANFQCNCRKCNPTTH